MRQQRALFSAMVLASVMAMPAFAVDYDLVINNGRVMDPETLFDSVAHAVDYITLPDRRRFAIAVFTNSSKTSVADRDRAIAEIARMLFDYFYVGQVAK